MEMEAPVTDISQLDNAIYIEPVEARCGTQVTLSVKMKNSVAVQTIQFDLYLPDGISVIANDDGELITVFQQFHSTRRCIATACPGHNHEYCRRRRRDMYGDSWRS